MIPRPLQKYLFYIILFILVIGIVFISTKYMLQRFFPKVEGFDVPDGPGLMSYSNSTLTLAPGITRFLTGGQNWTSTLGGIVHTYYGTPLTSTIIDDINYYEPMINYFYTISTQNGTTDEKIPTLVLTNGGTDASNWYVSTPTYGRITVKQLRRLSGPIADRIVRTMYLMIKAEIVKVEQATFTNHPANPPLVTGTYDSQFGGKNCMGPDGTYCSGAKVYSDVASSDYVKDNDNGALKHWRADFIQTKLPNAWIVNKPKMLAMKTYSKLYEENPDFATNYLAHTPELGDYAENAGMTIGMLLGGNLAMNILENLLYREVFAEITEEILDSTGKVVGQKVVGMAKGTKGIIPALKGIGSTLKANYTAGGARGVLKELGKGLVSRVAAQGTKVKELIAILKTTKDIAKRAATDAKVASIGGRVGIKVLAGAGRAASALKELAMISLGFDRSISVIRTTHAAAKAAKMAITTVEAGKLAATAAAAATTSLGAISTVGISAALASNPIGWGIAIVMALADIILMIVDLVPKEKFKELGIQTANKIIGDHILKCPLGTMDGDALADDEFSSIFDMLPLPANFGVQDVAMKKKLSCMYTDTLGMNVMSQKTQCPEGNDETCFAEAPMPLDIWPSAPEPVSRLTVLDLLDKISDEIDNLSSDYITITGYEWAAVNAVKTMRSKLAANASDFVSSYNAAVSACNLVQYGKISAAREREKAAAAAAAAVAARARANAATGSALGSALRAAIAAEAAAAAAEAVAIAAGTGAASYGIEWLKEGRSSYNAWWSDISGAIATTNVASVNNLTTPRNPDNFATRMQKNPFNWGDRVRHAPRFYTVADIAVASGGAYPDGNIINFLSTTNDDSYNNAIAGGSTPPKKTRYLCRPMDFYRTIKGVMINAILRKEIEAMKSEMDRYPDLIGKFAEDQYLGDTSLSEILSAAAITAAKAAAEDATAGRTTPSTTDARNAAVTAAVTAYSTALNAFYPVNISYTTVASFSSKINNAVWLTKLAAEATTAIGGIYDVSNTLILTSAGVTYEELDSRPNYISKYSTDVSGAYWNKKTIINADTSTRKVRAIAAWTALQTDFATANDPYAMSSIQWLIANTVAPRQPADATAAEKTAAAKRSTDALAPFQNTPNSTINTIINNIITQLSPANITPAVTSSNDFLAKFNAFISEMSYRENDLEKDKNAAYITSITADAARIGYNAWKSKYINTAIEMDALSTAKSIIYAFQMDGKKASVAQRIIDTRTEYINELINYHKGKDVRTFYINAVQTPGFKDPYIVNDVFGFKIEKYDGTKRATVVIPIMEMVNAWFLTPSGATRTINALNNGVTSLAQLIAESKPTASEIASYGTVPTLGWKWESGIECWQHTLNKAPCGINVCDGSTRPEYQWTAQKCVNKGDHLKRYDRMGSYLNFNLLSNDPKQRRMADYFKDVGGAICYEPGGQPVPTPCVAGEEFQAASMCLKNCAAGEWQWGVNCYKDCPSGSIPDPNGAKTNCITDCSGNYPRAISLVQCSEVCSTGDEEVYPNCYSPCTSGWNRASGVTCSRDACDSEASGFVDEVTPGFCYKKCALPGEYPSAYSITDNANKLNCIKQCSFDNNDGQNLSLVNVAPINAPTDIANCLAWLDATVGFTNGSTVWNSASPSLSYKMTVGGGPSLVANQLFSGSKNVLQLSKTQTLSMTPSPTSAAFTMFFVSRQTGPTYGRVFMSEPNKLYGYWGTSKNQLYMEGWISTVGGTAANTTWDSYRVRRRANGSGDFARFGSIINSFSSSAAGLTGLHVNKWEESEAQIAEIIIYNRDLTDTECQQVENYLLAKWFRQRIRIPGLQRCYYGCDDGWNLNRDVGTCEKNSCDSGQWDNGAGLCYNPCGSDRNEGGVGNLTCYLKSAPAGYHENVPGVDGNFAQDCPSGKQQQAADKTACVNNCPAGMSYDGALTCNRSTSSPRSDTFHIITSTPRSNAIRTDFHTPASAAIQLSCPGGYHGAAGWCQSDRHCCSRDNWGTCWRECDNMNPSTTAIQSSCPWNRPNNYNGTCYENCPAGQWMRSQGLCSSDSYCPGDTPNNFNGTCYANCPAGQTMKTQGICTTGEYCKAETPNRFLAMCYANCPAGQNMKSAGICSTDAALTQPAGGLQYMPTIPKGIGKTSRTKFQSAENKKWESRDITNGNLYWAKENRARAQTIPRSIAKTLKTIGRDSSVRPSYTAEYKHDINSVQGCECLIANAWERANNGCGTFGLLTQYPAAPWGAAAWQVNSDDPTVKTLITRLADLFVSNPSLLPDELFEEDHPLKNQGTPALERMIVLNDDKSEDTSMKNRLIRAYFDYVDALNYKDDIELICSPGYIETLMNDELGEPALNAPGAGRSYLSRPRNMYMVALGANDEDFKSYLTRYDKWKTDTQVAMSERALVTGGTFLDPFSRVFLDKLAQYLFDQTKSLLRGQFFHITKIFGLGYVSESCVELHCNANQYAAPPTTADAAIPKNLTITPITNWIVRFYLSGGNPVAYEFQNSNANAFMLTNKRCLYYGQNYVPVVYFNGYSHKCDSKEGLQKQVEFYRKKNNKVNVKYITAQKDITADQTLCAMQWQESDYNADTNQDGSQMVSKSGAFTWLRKGMPETPMKNSDGTYNFAYSPTKKNADGKDVYADTETVVTGDILTIKDGFGKGNYAYSETVVTGVLLTPADISTEVFNRINDTDSATEKQSIMDGATKAMVPINPPITVTSKLYREEEDLEGCFPMKCSNPYVMNLILTKFNGTTDPEGGTSKIITIKKIFTVNSGRCDMLANVISSNGVVEEQKRSATMVTMKDAAGAIVPCKYTVSAIGAKGTGTFITDSLSTLTPQMTAAKIAYDAGYGILSPATTTSVTGAIDTTRTGLETVAKAARLKSHAASGFEKKFVDCPAISCSSQEVLNAIVMQYAADNYPKTTANVLQKSMTKIFKVGTATSAEGNATCDINFENTSQFYTSFPGTPAGAANKTTITKRFKVTTSDTCKYSVVSDITTNDKTANLPKSSATDLTDTVSVLEDDPSFDKLAIVSNKPSTANSMAITVTRDTSGIKYTGTCPTPNFTDPGVLLDIARFIRAQNAANSFIVTSLYTPATVVSPTSCSIRVGYTRNGSAAAYMNTFTVSFTKDITTCRYRITRVTAGSESSAAAGGTAISTFVRPLNSCPSVPIACTSPAVQNEAKSFYKSMMTLLTNGIANTMNITKAAPAGTNTCEFQVTTQSGTATSTWDGTAANFNKFHYTFNFNPSPACDGINYVAYDMAPVSSSQNSHTIGDRVPENVACYSVLDCNNSSLKTKATNALNTSGPAGTTYSITGTPVKTGPNKCEYLVSRTTGGVTTSQDKLGSYDSTLHRSAVFKAKTPIVVRTAGMSDAAYTLALNTACYGSTGIDISGTVNPVVQAVSRTYVPISCPRIGTTSTSQTIFSHSSINAALVAALTNKYNDLKASGLLTVSFVRGGTFPITQINSITIDTTNPARITVPATYQRYEYRVVLNAGLSANAARVPAKAAAGNYNITQNDTDYAWNPYLHPIVNIFFYNTCGTPVITKENITFVASRPTSMYRTF